MLTQQVFVVHIKRIMDYTFTVLQLLSPTKWFLLQSSMTIFSPQVVDKRGYCQWMNSSVIHDSICSLIHKKCQPKRYHSDIKYHLTRNIIFSVVIDELVEFEK